MKMPKEQLNERMFAPCGMNCTLCYKHCYNKKPCEGCLQSDDGKPEHCRKCKIKDCVKERALKYCFECSEYPCKRLKYLEKSYQTRYGASLKENSLFVKENGLAEFMEQQKVKYTCPECGGIISIHDRECSECEKGFAEIIHISKAQGNDLEAILELQYLAYQSEAKLFNNKDIPPLRQTIQQVKTEYETGTILKAEDANGKIVGSVRGYLMNNTVHIGKLIVHPDLQRRGIGTRLLLEMERIYPDKRYELFTSTRSLSNIKMYKNLGYVIFKEEAVDNELKLIYLQKGDRNGI